MYCPPGIRIVMNLAFVQSVIVLSHYLGLWIQSHIHFHTRARYSREGVVVIWQLDFITITLY